MTNKILAVLASLIFVAGCAGKRINIDPANPVNQPKNNFEEKYGLFITSDEKKKGYAKEDYPDLSGSIKPFNEIDILEEFLRFEKHFWEIRDTDPGTPKNEFKELIDSRLQDIENELFATDMDIPGTRFEFNGGLRGDLAHVYLLYGMPHYKEKLSEGRYFTELMIWYYLDPSGRPIFRFLFYKQGGIGGYQLFKNHGMLMTTDRLFNPLMSPLKDISIRTAPTQEDLFYLWEELSMSDPTWMFRTALFEFSYFMDVQIDKALAPPEPAALTAERFKPTLLGQADIPEGREFFMSGYYSFVPAHLRTDVGPDDPSFLMLTVLYRNIDWEKQADGYVAHFDLRISFQNKKTLELTEFFTGFKTELISQERFKSRETAGSLVVFPVQLEHWDGEKFISTLGDMLKQLKPGEYIANIHLQHRITKKYNTWREEIVVSN